MAKKVKKVHTDEMLAIDSATLHQAREALQSKSNTVELPVDGTYVRFTLRIIPSSEIEETTEVFDGNDRLQSNLNEYSLSDILSTLGEKGQQYPAIGQLTENGKITVLDGSRRRAACVLAKKDYWIYVTDKSISYDYKKHLSDVANVSKPLSIFELGYRFKRLLEAQDNKPAKYDTIQDLSNGEKVTLSIVSNAVRAVTDIPEEIVRCIPSIADLGRPSANTLRSIVLEARNADILDKLVLFAQEESTAKQIAAELDDQATPSKLNQAFISRLRAQVKRTSAKTNPRSKAIYSKGKASAKIKGSNENFTITFKDLGTKKADIVSAIENLLNS